MKLLISLIGFLYLITCFAGDDDSSSGGKNKDDIAGGYAKCSTEDLEEVQLSVDLLKTDLILLIDEVETDPKFKVISAQKQIISTGTNYHASIKVDSDGAYGVFFYVPSRDVDEEQMPRDLKLIQTPTNSDSESKEDLGSESSDSSDALPGGWYLCDSQCLDERKADIKEMEDDVRDLLDLEDEVEIVVISASQQVVAGNNYRVVLDVDGKEKEVQYYVDLDKKKDKPLLVVNGEVIETAKADAEKIEKVKGKIKEEMESSDDSESSEDSKDDDLLEGYERCEGDKLLETRLYIDLLRDEILEKLELDDCEIDIVSAQAKKSTGTTFVVKITECDNESEIEFYVPSLEEDPMSIPKDLKILLDSPKIYESVNDDGTERILVECPPNMVLRDGECINEDISSSEEFNVPLPAKPDRDQMDEYFGGDEVSEKTDSEDAKESEDSDDTKDSEDSKEDDDKPDNKDSKYKEDTMDLCGCPLELEEVCCTKPGSNQPGITYATLCNAECHGRAKEHCTDGPCSPSAKAEGGKKKIEESESEESESESSEELLDGYTECDDMMITLAQSYVNVIHDDVLALLTLELSCELEVKFCQYKEDNGVQFIASVEECEGDADVEFYIPSSEEDPKREPKDIKASRKGSAAEEVEENIVCGQGEVPLNGACVAETADNLGALLDQLKQAGENVLDNLPTGEEIQDVVGDIGENVQDVVGNLPTGEEVQDVVGGIGENIQDTVSDLTPDLSIGEELSENVQDLINEEEEEEVAAGEAVSEKTDRECPEEDDPICCGGIEYRTPCDAECAGIDSPADEQKECIMGKCEDECVCTREYDAFCCEGTTYSNACEARCAGVDSPKLNCNKGSCDSQECQCPYVHQPLCCDNENYPNSCTAKCVGIEDPAEECTSGACEEELCACTHEYEPHCCEDKTYGNPCKARCDGHKFINFKCTRGTCEQEEPCNCPQKEEPVCCNKGSDREEEYGNICEAECHLDDTEFKTCESGKCEPDTGCICTTLWDPVCCLGSKSYGNLCDAECDGFHPSQCKRGGQCEDIRLCTMEYLPLCCAGKTYASPCLAEAAGIKEPAEDQDECKVGECGKETACTADYDPFCCGEITYGNECMAKAAGFEDPVKDCKEGKCDHSYCTLEHRPVCCEGETYDNLCLADKSGVTLAESNCLAGRCEDQTCLCSKIYDPLCCDGKDFGNECQAECNGFLDVDKECSHGTCRNECICTLEYDPQCCKDDDGEFTLDYSNKCEAECHGMDPNDANECVSRTCAEEQCLCTQEVNPICCHGKTYMNPCAAECDGVDKPAELQYHECVMGACDKHCLCTYEYDPICCDKTDYGNACEARCDGISNPLSCSRGRCDEQDEECICTREYKPHCCNGINYSNACLAKCDDKDVFDEEQCQRGRCDECVCTLNIDPVCCGDLGHEFDNQCIASCVGFDEDECQEGTCEDVAICTNEWKPLCCEEETFSNRCKARVAGVDLDKCTDGQCVDKDDDLCICPAIFKPVCCDNVDYDNECVAECDGVKDVTNKCYNGKCHKQSDCICTLEWDPLCCDEKTYFNPCNAECSGFDAPAEENELCSLGACEETLCKCDKKLAPVCCSGIDYDNECVAQCDGIKDIVEECALGTCKDQNNCICTREFNPICCVDREGNEWDYDSPCIASCDGLISNPNTQCVTGKCEDDKTEMCHCQRDYRPLCCDNVDYSNQCLAECDGIKDVESECKSGICREDLCKCTRELNPLCCNGIDYDNACLARCDNVLAAEYYCDKGRCDEQPQACSLNLDPVCCDGRDYANQCFAEREGFEEENCSSGRCCDVCVCGKEIEPVCCDGRDYTNKCIAECAGYDDPENNKLCEMSDCNDCKCNRKFNPICCDNKEYSNPCAAECADYDDALNNKQCELGQCGSSGGGSDDDCDKEKIDPICCKDKWGVNIEFDNECFAETVGGIKSPAAQQEECEMGKCNDSDCGCDTESDPVCCWNVEYENLCLAKCAGINNPEKKCSLHKCDESDEECVCTKEFDPICCQDEDGKRSDYDNLCLAECAGFDHPANKDENCILGTCEETHPCGCPLIVDEVCCDGVDYSSECDAECEGVDVKKCEANRCKESSSSSECQCTREYDPMCCDEKDDFDNKCLAECDAKYDVDKDCVYGSCTSIGCECGKDLDPFCCEETTYDNECVVKCNGFDVEKDCDEGYCSDDKEESSAALGGIFSLSSGKYHSHQWNVLIVIIQLCILAVCCMSLGLSISFCFKNPNNLSLFAQNKQRVFDRDQ